MQFRKTPIAAAVGSVAAYGALVGGAAIAPGIAFAEDADVIEEVVVTGSRIRRADLESFSPVSVVDNEEFTISGIMNVEQKLAQLPQTLPAFGPSSNNPGDGTARVDLRGLGTFRTLVLVNGRRYMPATQTGVVDLNTIPASLIESVEVMTGGASAVYGSDALSGVVNFRLKEDFEGIEINSLYDTTGEGDAEKLNIDITIGGNFDNGRGNAVAYLQYSDREALFQGDRSFSNVALTDSTDANGNPILTAGGSSGIPGTRVFGGPTINPDGILGNADDFTLGRFNPDGTGAAFQDPADRFNYAPDNFLQLPQQRYLVHGRAHYDVTERVRAYAEMTFAQNEVPQELAPTPAFVGSLVVNPDSPFFAPSVQTALAGIRTDTNGDGNIDGADNATLPFIGRRMVENGSRQAIDNRDSYRMMAGITGNLTDKWTYDLYASRARLDGTNLLENDVSETRFRQAILVNDAGTACQDTSNNCVPLNIFGAGNISDAAIGFINVGASNVTDITLTVYQGTLTGLVSNPINEDQDIGLVFGGEYREDKSTFRPDTFLSSGDVLGFNAGRATVGSFDVTEFFTEVDVPILNDVAGAEYLGVRGAFRYSDYSNIGDIQSYAITGTYNPVQSVSLRGGFQRAVRAPNVSELFLGSANGFPTATDPCAAEGNPAAGITALCEATGVLPGQVGVFNQANSQIEGRFGGNPNLKEETADTFTVGAVFTPDMEFIPGNLDFTIDYYSIEIEDAIDVLGGGVNNVLDICYNQIGDINSSFCQAITRRADGNVDVVQVLNANIAKLETQGLDFQANWNFPLEFGVMGNDSNVTVTYRSNVLLNFEETPTVGLPNVNQCEGSFGNTCGDPRPEYQHSVRGTIDSGPFTLSLLWRFLGESDDDRIENAGTAANTLAVPTIDSISYLDLSGAWRVTENLRLNFGITNLTDKEPDEVGDVQEQANTFPETYDVIGRRFFVSGRYTF